MALSAQFHMLILALYLAVHISSTPGFSFEEVLIQDLLLQSLLQLATLLEDV